MRDTANRFANGLSSRRHPTEPDELDHSIEPLTAAQFMHVTIWFAREILACALEVADEVTDASEIRLDNESELVN